ncbi:class A beta-lactamase [Aeromicrobium chenweiae]|uniref:Beta-lactamase n=1 Tax=Aeromicrobium chenweiae TaxID=2079793 RepID=A0A2S0WL76_9ACTN|nr:class A beta-lactamase [Aeromicrobium chenweiae]AWB92098.1 class A beta-lactamase [Aeromicrobium chenweiae]TGN32947.1 class A beta-lactamase [Aeromicrobium chenweiae]
MQLSRTRPAAWFTVTIALLAGACGPSSADAPASAGGKDQSRPAATTAPDTRGDFAAIETSYDTRLGVFALDTGTGRRVSWRSSERFPFASTIKAPLAAVVLDRTSRRDLSRTITYDASDLVPHSPVTEKHVADGLPLRDVIDAALRFSDNTAANLLFDQIGGPAGLDRELDRIGDRVTNPVRTEPDLNTATPGDVRDTTTPKALATTVGTYVVGRALPRHDRDLLRTTMTNNTTGDALIRAGVPDGWVVADRTGGASHGVRTAVAVAFPPGRSPVLIAVMSRRDQADDEYDDGVVADATRVAVDALGLS